MLLVVSGALLTGCANSTRGFGTFSGPSGGVCDAFDRPQYQIKGATAYDQEWADKTTEAGVAGCSWARPEPRPKHLDVDPAAPVKFVPPAPKKRSLWNRIRHPKSS